jgi:hypothetical protein
MEKQVILLGVPFSGKQQFLKECFHTLFNGCHIREHNVALFQVDETISDLTLESMSTILVYLDVDRDLISRRNNITESLGGISFDTNVIESYNNVVGDVFQQYVDHVGGIFESVHHFKWVTEGHLVNGHWDLVKKYE